MDVHYKREVLEKYLKYEVEKCYCSISFLKPATNSSIIYDFKQNGHVSYHVTY